MSTTSHDHGTTSADFTAAADTPFPAHTVRTAPDRSRPALEGVGRALGFVPNLFATMAGSPETLAGYLALDGVLAKGTFGPAERQLILTAVSAANGCAYCTAAHSTFAAGLRAAPDALAAARGAGHAADARTDALIGFTHAVVRERGHVGREAVGRFLAAGFTPAQAMEVAANVGLKTISNYIDGFAEITLDDALAPQRWEPAVPAR
jgi:uncharacterized peroxidase-related enzyme